MMIIRKEKKITILFIKLIDRKQNGKILISKTGSTRYCNENGNKIK